jgi:uncharacterized protein (DUF1778 family)
MTDNTKRLMVRMPQTTALLLEHASDVDGESQNSFIVRAIDDRIQARREDPEFRRRLQEHLKSNVEALKQLA